MTKESVGDSLTGPSGRALYLWTDLLPAVLPGERRYQTLLALLIPIAIAAVMIAGRAAALAVLRVARR